MAKENWLERGKTNHHQAKQQQLGKHKSNDVISTLALLLEAGLINAHLDRKWSWAQPLPYHSFLMVRAIKMKELRVADVGGFIGHCKPWLCSPPWSKIYKIVCIIAFIWIRSTLFSVNALPKAGVAYYITYMYSVCRFCWYKVGLELSQAAAE